MEISKNKVRKESEVFRSEIKEEARSAAEKSLTLEKRGDVAILWFDQFQEKANKLSTANMLRLFDLFTQVEEDSKIGCLVILSKKPSIFVAGADISEISLLSEGKGNAESLMKLQAVFNYLEQLRVPSIAAINGACMGGGTEFALACDYRMVTDAPETKIALPEVLLGVIPGWGGTQRLPRLIGLEKALDLILTGRAVDGRKAKKMGLADRMVPKEFLEEKALAWASELAKTKKKKIKTDSEWKELVLRNVPMAKWVVLDQAKKMVLEKTKGNYPAPLAAISVIRKTYGGNLEAGLKKEAEAFMELVRTPESKNLISVFYLNEKVKKDTGVGAAIKGREVQRAAVVGAGTMGGGIAQLFSAKNIRTQLQDIKWDFIAKGMAAAYKVFKKNVEKKKMKLSELQNAMSRIQGTTTYSGFKSVDVVVEAVVEDLEIKKKVFQELEKQCEAKAIFATNTSSLPITQVAEGVKDPSRVVGMHFFNPVDKMPLVEIIRGAKSSDEAVATVFQLAKKLGKTPIVVKDSPAFLVNRILGPYLNEAGYLLSEGISPTRIDSIIEKFGMPMGPCTLLDEVGLDVASKVSKILYGAFGERLKAHPLVDQIAKDGRLGKKTKKGIYLYEGKTKTEDTAYLTSLRSEGTQRVISDDTIEKRLIYLMVNEGARCVEEKLVRDISDIDLGMIYGTGFAPFRGGLLRYADSVGAEAIVSELEVLQRSYGTRFQPANYLQQLSVNGKKFY